MSPPDRVRAYRLVKRRYAAAAFDGAGARRFGGRWNGVGTAVVYASGSRSLATLELLVHVRTPSLLAAYVVIPVTFPPSLVETLDVARLPDDWTRFPAPAELSRIGDRWVDEARSAVLAVPSAVVPQEFNYLLNPAHRAFAMIEISAPEELRLDARLGPTGA